MCASRRKGCWYLASAGYGGPARSSDYHPITTPKVNKIYCANRQTNFYSFIIRSAFSEILAWTPGGPLKNIFRNIFDVRCADGLYLKSILLQPGVYSKHATGAVNIPNMVLSICDLENSLKLLMVLKHMVQDHKLR